MSLDGSLPTMCFVFSLTTNGIIQGSYQPLSECVWDLRKGPS